MERLAQSHTLRLALFCFVVDAVRCGYFPLSTPLSTHYFCHTFFPSPPSAFSPSSPTIRLHRDTVCSPPLAHPSWTHHHNQQHHHRHQEPHEDHHHQRRQLHHHRGAASPWDSGGAAGDLDRVDGASLLAGADDDVISRGGGRDNNGGGSGRHLAVHGVGDETVTSGHVGKRDEGSGGDSGNGSGGGGGGGGGRGGARVDGRRHISIPWGKNASDSRGHSPRWNARGIAEREVEVRRAGGSSSTGRGRSLTVEGCVRGDDGCTEPLSNVRREDEEERYRSRTGAVTLSDVEKEGMESGGGAIWSSSREHRQRGGRRDDFFRQEDTDRGPPLATAEGTYTAAGRKRCRRDLHGGEGEVVRGSAVSSNGGGSGSGGSAGGERENCIGGRGDNDWRTRRGGSAGGARSFPGAPLWSDRLAGAVRSPLGVGISGDQVGEAAADSSPERDRHRPSVRRRVDTDRDGTDRDGRAACR